MSRDGFSGGELLIVGFGGSAILLAEIVWVGAALAAALSGERLDASLADAIHATIDLPQHLTDPANAWPPTAARRLPAPFLYWSCTLAVTLPTAVTAALVLRAWRGPRVGTAPRRPLGVDARARFARARDLRPLRVQGPQQGRLILGRVGHTLVATETPPPRTTRQRRARRSRSRAGDRGAVALVGPSRSGKTTTAIAGILEWDGPAILSSVKDDLLRTTIDWRSGQGAVAVFDPTNTTGRANASWTPLRDAGTTLGAQRAARALCEAAPKATNVDGGLDFWLAQAEILLSALLYIAHHHDGADMGTVAQWILTQDRPGDWGPGDVKGALDLLLDDPNRQIRDGAEDAARALLGIWSDEERSRSGTYATARTVTWPWSDPHLAHTTDGTPVDLDWLTRGSNTLYLCAPIEDQIRLAPAFGGLLNDLINQIYRCVAATGQPVDPPLLLVIDEAGNTPLRRLPQYASTLAGMGVLLVTVWQSLAQIEGAYARQAGTILTNHLTKLFYAGLSDTETHRYLATILGDDETETHSRTTDITAGRGSLQRSTSRTSLAPAHTLRQMRPGHALLLHSTLPPAHLRARPYFKEAALRERAAMRRAH
jgi:type IV secretion system protein VirD4